MLLYLSDNVHSYKLTAWICHFLFTFVRYKRYSVQFWLKFGLKIQENSVRHTLLKTMLYVHLDSINCMFCVLPMSSSTIHLLDSSHPHWLFCRSKLLCPVRPRLDKATVKVLSSWLPCSSVGLQLPVLSADMEMPSIPVYFLSSWHTHPYSFIYQDF